MTSGGFILPYSPAPATRTNDWYCYHALDGDDTRFNQGCPMYDEALYPQEYGSVLKASSEVSPLGFTSEGCERKCRDVRVVGRYCNPGPPGGRGACIVGDLVAAGERGLQGFAFGGYSGAGGATLCETYAANNCQAPASLL